MMVIGYCRVVLSRAFPPRKTPVVKSGQTVMVADVADRIVFLLALGDIPEDRDLAIELAFFIFDPGCGHGNEKAFP
jgi:hypothetical protein